MNFCDFGIQDDDCKTFLVWHYGTYLFSRFDNLYEYRLCAIEDFYVEVKLSLRDNQIVEIYHYKEGRRLDSFLKLINLYEITTRLVVQ